MKLFAILIQVGVLATTALSASYIPRPYDAIYRKRQTESTNSSVEVDLGYSVYRGVSNSTSGLNIFRGIRYAAAPLGDLRWQLPIPPPLNSSAVVDASSFGNICPQSERSGGRPAPVSQTQSEDCLFLNVFAPQNASNLPVLVWIHGGGYGRGSGTQGMSNIITTNGHGFIGVSIQYRLGAFGFLSSDEVHRFGTENAGLRDQHLALQWVQKYIHLFGGDPARVTVSGVSAGAGSVMLQATSFGGTIGDSVMSAGIVANPYLPMQYGYADWQPSQSYYAFATEAGCFNGFAAQNPMQKTSIFKCLQQQDTDILMSVSFNISTMGMYGSYVFAPVTDGVFVTDTPSRQLLRKEVNGQRMLSGNNANEGPLFVPQNITSDEDLTNWIETTFPLLSPDDIIKLLVYYPSEPSSDPIKFGTTGTSGPTAINQSSISIGNQQRANNIYAESVFVCPSYWLAEAFTGNDRQAYKYEVSALPALHGLDMYAYFDEPRDASQGEAFSEELGKIWGNFVMSGNPSVAGLEDWPVWDSRNAAMANLNQTGGQLVNSTVQGGYLYQSYGENLNTTYFAGDGRKPAFEVVNARSWEGDRGVRCDFWRSIGGIVPE